jgi:hypothetical protein
MPFPRLLLSRDGVEEFRAPGILLSAEGLGERPKWIQIAYAGEWKGHHQGAFRLTRESFERIVANFHTHPAYKGGKSDVVAFDFDHASEMPPTSAAVALAGKPAQGWVQELEVRDVNGAATLWAFTRVLEPARTYLTQGKIKWVSAAIDFHARDLVTGDPIGPALTSVAFTNQPFLRALPAIAASVRPLPTQKDKPMKLTPMLLSALAIVTLTPTDEEIEAGVVKLANRNRELEKENEELKKTGAEGDVDAALLAYGPKDEPASKMLRPALLAMRTHDPKGFAAAYPKLPPTAAALTQRITPAAPVHGAHLAYQAPQVQNRSLQALGSQGGQVMLGNAQPAPTLPAAAPSSGAEEHPAIAFSKKLLAMPGLNKHERALNYVRLNGGKDLSFEQAHVQASMMLAAHGIPKEIVDVTELLQTG